MLEETLIKWRDDARREGLREGLREGRKEGIEVTRQILLDLLEQRFGTLPPPVRRKVKSLSSTKRLQELAKRVLLAGSLAEMGLG
jgi:flagellar biosynthesis/type III secretory pathway protein FliH